MTNEPGERMDDNGGPGRQAARRKEKNMECEIKLLVDAASAAQIKKSPVLRAFAVSKPQEQEQIDRYFDTGKFDLWKHGLALRVHEATPPRIGSASKAERGCATRPRFRQSRDGPSAPDGSAPGAGIPGASSASTAPWHPGIRMQAAA